MKSIQTLGVVVDDDKILLGIKKRGFGEGRWNGFGGKIKEGETIEDALKREFLEEVEIKIIEFEPAGVLNFHFADKPLQPEVHIFRVIKYSGEPVESEEMRPEWFDLDKTPYDSMWPSDPLWLPQFLAGEKFSGEVHFAEDGSISSHTINTVRTTEIRESRENRETRETR